MQKTSLLFVLLAWLTGVSAVAQQIPGPGYSDKPLRVEIPAKSTNETYRIIPCGSKGIVLFFKSQDEAGAGEVKWYFVLYDTNLQVRWTKSVPILNDLDYRFDQRDGDTLSLLFVHAGKTRGQESDFEILRIILDKAVMILNTGKIDQEAEVAGFGMQPGRGWLGYNLKGKPGSLINIRLDNGLIHAFPLGQGNQVSVRWLTPDSAASTVMAFVTRQVSKNTMEHFLVRYDSAGRILNEIRVGSQDDGRFLTQSGYLPGRGGSGLLVGFYGQDIKNQGQKDRGLEGSTGFFASQLAGGMQTAIHYYNFLEMDCASSMISGEDIISLKKKALKKNRSLSEYSLDFSLLLNPVFTWNDQVIVTAEVVSPQYHTENITDFDYYGRPYTNSYPVFDGYRFSNTLIAGFDMSGKLLWDNHFEIRNLVSAELSRKVVIFPSGNDLVLCYLTDGTIGSKIIRENGVVEKSDFTPIDLSNPEDKLLNESTAKMLQWYDNYFVISGYQEIKNIAAGSNNKRLVFYFSKIRFER